MADTPEAQKLSLADQVLVNAMGALSAWVLHDGARAQLMIDVIGGVLPHVTRSNPFIARLIPAAEAYLAPALGADAPRGFGSARLQASGPTGDFFQWRAGIALSHWCVKQAEAVE